MILTALLLDAALLAGYGATSGIGERPGVEASAYVHTKRLAIEAGYYSADKVESGEGWGVHGAAELRHKGIGAGVSYSYRDGGQWDKHYAWARASVGRGPVRVVGEWALGGYNRERKVELRSTARVGWVIVEPRVFVEWHLQGTAYGAVLLVGLGR